MKDAEHAAKIRAAAAALVTAIEAACETGLLVEATVKNYGTAWSGSTTTKQFSWAASVDVRRVIPL